MVSEWMELALEDAMDALIDYRGKTPKKTDNGIPLITAKIIKNGRINPTQEYIAESDYDSWMRRGFPKKGDVVLTTEAPLGEVAQLDGKKIALAQRVITLRGKAGLLESDFLLYLLQSNDVQHQLDSRASGTTVKGIKQSELRKVILRFPPLAEQKAIAHVLGALDDKIELNRQMNATLEGMAQALFKSWFVDFDPVLDNALAAGNPIPDALAERAETRRQALANGTANREAARPFPATFHFTEDLGWIPAGWEARQLDKIAVFRNGLALQKFRPTPDETALPIVKIAQLKSGVATRKELASANITPECIIDDGDVVFSWSGSLMIDLWCGGKAALNQHLFKVTSTDFPKWFYLGWSNEHLLNFQRIAAAKAVTMGHIKRGHLSEAYCAIPNHSLLVQANEVIAPYIEKIIRQRVENRTLAKLRDTLLPKLISGELRIPTAAKRVEEAVA